ncbi:MAG: peroxide stress protein YaaA, partial [Nocardioides sp.]
MLILLPPSEGKSGAKRGKPLDLAGLGFPELTAPRERVLDALARLCDGPPDAAAKTLGLGPTQLDLVTLNRTLRIAPTQRADHVYTGVLYDALDVATLSTAAKRRATARVAVTSSVFGLVRPSDRIPPYRLSGDTTLPGLGPVAGVWREHLGAVVTETVGTGLLVDLRSGTYVSFWRPAGVRSATVRVLHEHQGKRKVVSHFNKATKGRIVRALLESGAEPRTPTALAPRVATVRVLHEVKGERQVVSHFNKATKGRIVRAVLEDGGNPRTPGKLADLLTALG